MDDIVQFFKWLSQLLILVGGVGALRSDTHELDSTTGRPRLTHNGRMKLSILAVGFFLFILTDFQNRAQQREAILIREHEIRLQDKAIEKQNTQLEYLRRLFLLQHEVSAVEVSWPLSDQDIEDFSQSLLSYGEHHRADSKVKTNLQYINDAFKNSMSSGNSWLNVYQIALGRFALQVLICRPFGMKLIEFPEEQPEWKAFSAAIQKLLGDRFEIEVAPGVVLADLAKKHWPCEVSIDSSTIHFKVEEPGVTLGQLEGASITFWEGDIKTARMPKRLSLRFKDPKVELDQQFELKWEEFVLFSATNEEEGYEVKYSNMKAGPFQLYAKIKYDLLPQIDSSPAARAKQP